MGKRERKATSGQRKNPARKSSARKKAPRGLGAPGKSGAGLTTNEISAKTTRPSSRGGLPRALFKTAVATLRKGIRRIPRDQSFHILPVGGADYLKTKVKEQSAKRSSARTGQRTSKVGHGRKGRS